MGARGRGRMLIMLRCSVFPFTSRLMVELSDTSGLETCRCADLGTRDCLFSQRRRHLLLVTPVTEAPRILRESGLRRLDYDYDMFSSTSASCNSRDGESITEWGTRNRRLERWIEKAQVPPNHTADCVYTRSISHAGCCKQSRVARVADGRG
jgi:hypothetical protein